MISSLETDSQHVQIQSNTKDISFISDIINSVILAVERDHYEILGVSRYATVEEITEKYRKLVLELHPDHNSDPDATERLKEINDAYEILSDEEKRQQYDYYTYHYANNMRDVSPVKPRSMMWYIAPVIFGIIGGVIAYFAIRRDDPGKAKNCLYIGLMMLGISIVVNVLVLSTSSTQEISNINF